jgi:hypothetical protein
MQTYQGQSPEGQSLFAFLSKATQLHNVVLKCIL